MRRTMWIVAGATLTGCPCPAVPPSQQVARPSPIVREAPPPVGSERVRLAVGGDSRRALFRPDDDPGVLRWAFGEATRAGVNTFFYLGDMELTPPPTQHFLRDLSALRNDIRLCPVFGNHEALVLGELDLMPHGETSRYFTQHFLFRCLRPEAMPAVEDRARDGRVYYAVDLPGDVHLVALDNASTEPGFGEAQLRWLAQDLRSARARHQRVIVGMHKALANNGVTDHSMDEDDIDNDPASASVESAKALALFHAHDVKLIVASHAHGFWEFTHPGSRIPSFITGGLGAPLKECAGPAHAFYHFLLVDVTRDGIHVTVVRKPTP